ncbi:MAG: ComF [uncultured bacterium]|nr:MAG: ComF [uncultured bacterium]
MDNKLLFRNTLDFVLDLLFPKYCVGCGEESKWLCSKCADKIILIKTPTCPTCQKITKNGQFCSRCRTKTSLTGVMVAAYYGEGPLKEAIHTFKYDGIFDLAKDLGKILLTRLTHIPLPLIRLASERPEFHRRTKWNMGNVVIIPIPLHKKRQAKRGFNQAELLAKQLKIKNEKLKTKNWTIITNKLIRHKYQKKSQAELSGKARRINLKESFSWVGDKNELKGKIILLVDDVYTTGSTLNECAKVLRREAGASQVWGLVLAKA